MNISEEQIRRILLKVIRETQSQQILHRKQKLCIPAVTKLDGSYLSFLDSLHCQSQYEICTVVPDQWKDDGTIGQLSVFSNEITIYTESEYPIDGKQDMQVFPSVPRNLIVKTALGIDDSFETQWVRKCMERGEKIVFLKSGLEHFTGNEPESYTARILQYYRMVLEYGIEICDFVKAQLYLEQQFQKPKRAEDGFASHLVRKKKVITANNLNEFVRQDTVYLYPEDLITDTARDRAMEMGIVIEKVK